MSLFIFICLLIARAMAEFDPMHPPRTENFDPANADPRGNITCKGPLPPFDFPFADTSFSWRLFSSISRGTTLQQLCAKPQYGGLGRGRHMGGFCARVDDGAGARWNQVAFDDTASAQTYATNTAYRLMHYCQLRCFCNDASSHDHATQVSTQLPDEGLSHLLQPDAIGDSAAMADARVLFVLRGSQVLEQQEGFHTDDNFYVEHVSLGPLNHLSCPGMAPRMAISLYDYRGPEFGTYPHLIRTSQSAQSLCANMFNDGSR